MKREGRYIHSQPDDAHTIPVAMQSWTSRLTTPLSDAVRRASRAVRGQRHLPTEIREFLVDALESHGDVCGGMCGVGVWIVESERYGQY
jgi:hypothetical protein